MLADVNIFFLIYNIIFKCRNVYKNRGGMFGNEDKVFFVWYFEALCRAFFCLLKYIFGSIKSITTPNQTKLTNQLMLEVSLN